MGKLFSSPKFLAIAIGGVAALLISVAGGALGRLSDLDGLVVQYRLFQFLLSELLTLVVTHF